MSVAELPDRYGECADCDTPEGDIICRACSDEEHAIAMRRILERMKTVAPGLTNSEVALLERFIEAVEAL